MGLYDTLTFEDGLDIEFPDFDHDPTTVTWQTKSIGSEPLLETYKITCDRRLVKENAEYETVPVEERPRYDEELEGFEHEYERALGMIRKIHQGWVDTDYHGTFEFHTSIDGTYYSFEAKFTDGSLVEIRRNG